MVDKWNLPGQWMANWMEVCCKYATHVNVKTWMNVDFLLELKRFVQFTVLILLH